MERRLAAILVADVVGYSRLMGEDEAGTLERLKACEADGELKIMEIDEASKEQKFGITKAATPMQAIGWMNDGVVISRCLPNPVNLNASLAIVCWRSSIESVISVFVYATRVEASNLGLTVTYIC